MPKCTAPIEGHKNLHGAMQCPACKPLAKQGRRPKDGWPASLSVRTRRPARKLPTRTTRHGRASASKRYTRPAATPPRQRGTPRRQTSLVERTVVRWRTKSRARASWERMLPVASDVLVAGATDEVRVAVCDAAIELSLWAAGESRGSHRLCRDLAAIRSAIDPGTAIDAAARLAVTQLKALGWPRLYAETVGALLRRLGRLAADAVDPAASTRLALVLLSLAVCADTSRCTAGLNSTADLAREILQSSGAAG